MKVNEKPERVLAATGKLTGEELGYLNNPGLWEPLSTPEAKTLLNRIVKGIFYEHADSSSPYFKLTQELLLTRSDAYEVCIDSARHMRDALLGTTIDRLDTDKGGHVMRLANALISFKDANPTQKSNPAWRAGVVNTMIEAEINSTKLAIKRQQEELKRLEAKQNSVSQIANGKKTTVSEKESELL